MGNQIKKLLLIVTAILVVIVGLGWGYTGASWFGAEHERAFWISLGCGFLPMAAYISLVDAYEQYRETTEPKTGNRMLFGLCLLVIGALVTASWFGTQATIGAFHNRKAEEKQRAIDLEELAPKLTIATSDCQRGQLVDLANFSDKITFVPGRFLFLEVKERFSKSLEEIEAVVLLIESSEKSFGDYHYDGFNPNKVEVFGGSSKFCLVDRLASHIFRFSVTVTPHPKLKVSSSNMKTLRLGTGAHIGQYLVEEMYEKFNGETFEPFVANLSNRAEIWINTW